MPVIHNLGFPRIGAQRELKFALEAYWRGELSADTLQQQAADLRKKYWQQQSALDLVPVGDFSLYDHVLDMSVTLGNLPQRARRPEEDELSGYFRHARGRAPGDAADSNVAAGQMTKWFNTNYHYIVPEFDASTRFQLDPTRLLEQIQEVKELGLKAKPVILGPVSYLRLGKSTDGTDPLTLLPQLTAVYSQLLAALEADGIEWIQIDEPILMTTLEPDWQRAFEQAYHGLHKGNLKLLLTTYFGRLQENLQLACQLPVAGLHIDAVNAGDEIETLLDWLSPFKILSLGVIDGRNVWRADLAGLINRLRPVYERLGERLWLAPSCSLLHVPVDLDSETGIDDELRGWLSFAVQKLAELRLLAAALQDGSETHAEVLGVHSAALASRQRSPRLFDATARESLAAVSETMSERQAPFDKRNVLQQAALGLPIFPTTTIGSFPQTASIRHARKNLRAGTLSLGEYDKFLREEIRHCLQKQQSIGLDVLVHGEAERNDMVEYFSEHLAGFAHTRHGWVQSYGSRCVKPPILFGDVSRPRPITVRWSEYAQSQTDKPVKGMLTGPVTLLNWSFVREDQPRADTCRQLALAMREEVLALEQAGIRIIQIDEAAIREGLPLRREEWSTYLDWAVNCFRLCANGVSNSTQIHTHMCYSSFNDIMPAISAMDADVITIETSRSNMALLDAFENFDYPNDIGPGVYDIHSPNTPTDAQIVDQVQAALQRISPERLWVNPDCGLKTRQWDEVEPALRNMVSAARQLREMARRPDTCRDMERASPSTGDAAIA